ncbi:MAG: single-stranded DNA-binding protein [Bacteroidota bacterium]
MARSINKVILIGNLGKDPEVRRLENGAAVASFSLATTETYKDRNTGESKSHTDWHNIVMWRGLAEVAEKYLKKGMQIYVEGKIRNRSYQDKDGNTKYITEVVADNMVMMSRAGSSENTPSQESPSFSPSDDTGGDDLPF